MSKLVNVYHIIVYYMYVICYICCFILLCRFCRKCKPSTQVHNTANEQLPHLAGCVIAIVEDFPLYRVMTAQLPKPVNDEQDSTHVDMMMSLVLYRTKLE